jgi:signal transduction histidine kinase
LQYVEPRNGAEEVRMSLPDFIEANLDALVEDWTEFAAQLIGQGEQLTVDQLQNTARQMLQRVAADMRLSQSGDLQKAKSRGESGGGTADVTNAALGHADDRREHGFTLDHLVAEFRALRATVLRRWQQTPLDMPGALEEMVRFNEAIDQLLTESVRQYSLRVGQTKDRFVGVLAHDLRSPLGTITNSTAVLCAASRCLRRT